MTASPLGPLTRRSFLAGGIAAAGIAALASCSASGGTGKSTVTVMYASSEFTKAHIKAFEKANPDIAISFIEYDDARLSAMITAGNPPDFVRSPPSANTFARGLAAPLDDYIASSSVIEKSDLLAINDNWRWDGKKLGHGSYYGLVKDWSQDASLWQNTALMRKAGMEPLSTTDSISWDTLLTAAQKVQAGSGAKYGLGIEWQWGLAAPAFTMILQQGGSIYNADLTEADFTTPEAARALQWFVDYGKADVGVTALNPLPDGFDLSTFQNGQMAMSQDGFWYGGNFSAKGTALQDSVLMAPAPSFDKRVNGSYNGGIGAWIPAASKNKDAAWKVMEFFIAGAPAVERAKSGYGLPALQSMWKYIPQELPYQKSAFATAQSELKYLTTLPDSPYVTAATWISAIDKSLQSILQGQSTVEDEGKRITDTVNKAMAQSKDQLG